MKSFLLTYRVCKEKVSGEFMVRNIVEECVSIFMLFMYNRKFAYQPVRVFVYKK